LASNLFQFQVKHAIAKASSLFILHLTLAAEQFRQTTKRSTISADDILRALHDVEFQELVPAMEIHLAAIRQNASAKRMKRKAGKQMGVGQFDSKLLQTDKYCLLFSLGFWNYSNDCFIFCHLFSLVQQKKTISPKRPLYKEI